MTYEITMEKHEQKEKLISFFVLKTIHHIKDDDNDEYCHNSILLFPKITFFY